MTAKKDDDCLTADDDRKDLVLKVTYTSRADLVTKLQNIVDSIADDADLFFNKPTWFDSYRGNCCGGGGP